MEKLRYQQPGTAPATLVVPPEQLGHKPVIKVIDYDAHSIEERRIQKIDEVFECRAASAVFNAAALREIARRVTNHAAGGVVDLYIHQDLQAIRQAAQLVPRLPKKSASRSTWHPPSPSYNPRRA